MMWKIVVELDRSQITIWHMRIVCWVPKATNTHSEYVILIAFPLQQWCMNMPPCYILCTSPILLCMLRTLPWIKCSVFHRCAIAWTPGLWEDHDGKSNG